MMVGHDAFYRTYNDGVAIQHSSSQDSLQRLGLLKIGGIEALLSQF
jgi:hypothetical protein